MCVIACKFGGSSAANAERIKQIYDILRSDGRRRYVALSAPGAVDGEEKVTDLLYRCWAVRRAGGDVSPVMEAIVRRFHDIAEGLGIPDKDAVVRREIERGLSISRAHTASRGEYLCARLFSGFTGIPMADAAGLIWFDRSGRLEEARTLRSIRELARRLPMAVVPGFYGSDPEGRIVTFPRNGSDITGALLAAGTGAAVYENWTDVPGLMTGDPDMDPEARVIPEISYEGMRELSRKGARVLHPDCLGPVEQSGIPTRIRCTMDPDAPGTVIRG